MQTVLRPDGAAQAEVGIIGDAHRVVFILIFDDGQHRPEDFFLRDGGVVVHVGEHGGLDEPAIAGIFGPAAPRNQTRLGFTLGNVAFHHVAMRLGGHGANLGFRVQRAANFQRLGHAGDGIDNFVITAGRHQNAGARRAGLAVIAEGRKAHAFEQRGNFGVFQNDRGRLAAQFKGHRAQQAAAHLRNLAAGRRGAGEGHLVDAGVRHKVGAHFTITRHPVDHPGRNAGLLRRFGDDVAVEHGAGRRLEHQGAARHQRWPDLENGQQHRVVPRHDAADHAQRFAADQRVEAHGRRTALFKLHGAGHVRVIAQQADHIRAFELRRQADGHAVLRADGGADFGRTLLDCVSKSVDQGAALGAGRAAPGAIECGARGHDRTINIGFCPFRHAADHFAGVGTDHLESL